MEQNSRKGFHPLRAIKERINKIGTLNFVLILVGAFFVWFNWKMLSIFSSAELFRKHTLVQLLRQR